ncbi:DNA-binding response regulator [Nocardiopsis sp. NPDC050513]|uniref:DNA-binding response regulator n=1 Tax=Nocardiopsis sp. NPDC050513 TaxID=3364338 RepID=UPI0037BB6739
MPHEQTITLRGEAELATRTRHLFAGVRSEFVCAATDLNTWSRPDARADAARGMTASRAKGVAVRKLFTPVALADEEARHHLFELADRGARVRICTTELPHETILIDRRVLILAGAASAGERAFTVTTSATLIGGVYALFRAAWDTAADLGTYLRRERPFIDDRQRAILGALADGLTDEAAARRLGLSLRTYRRRVADLLRTLDAGSRFQAGVRAGERGLVG